jgi:hypothetical protein
MKTTLLLSVFAVGTVFGAPAFAQHDPNDPNDPSRHLRGRAFEHQQSRVPLHAGGDIYYERNNNLNPDFQLGGSWWKRHHRKHAPPARSVERK